MDADEHERARQIVFAGAIVASKPGVLCLMGPTASGKTELALHLAQQLPCEIISVDSALIYRDMDIGTAKPDAQELAVAPHHLIDIRNVQQSYSAAEFRVDALQLIAEVQNRGKLPLLVGGTMLYFKALRDGLAQLPAADTAVRQQLEQDRQALGLAALHQQLAEVDPVAAARIHRNDPQRLLRALEVYRLTGESMTAIHQRQQQNNVLPFNLECCAVMPQQRTLLHERIAQRFQKMLDAGLVDEVSKLYDLPDTHADLPAMRAVGYRQVWQYLDKQCDYATMVERGIVATRQLAKRQITWLRSWGQLHYLSAQDENRFAKFLKLAKNISI